MAGSSAIQSLVTKTHKVSLPGVKHLVTRVARKAKSSFGAPTVSSVAEIESPGLDPERRALVRYAHEANQRQQWVTAHALWTELDRQIPETFCRVMALETARLAGLLPLLHLEARDTASSIISALSAPHAENLLADVIRRSEAVSEAEFVNLVNAYSSLPPNVRGALAHSVLRHEDQSRLALLGGTTVPLASISSASPTKRTVVTEAHEAELPELDLLASDIELPSTGLNVKFRTTEILEFASVLATATSDALRVDGEWCLDALAYPHSDIIDVTLDPVVLAISRESAIIENDLANPGSIHAALWLGYPLTEAWGHFLLECLTRLAIFHSAHSGANMAVVVNSTVPASFLDFAQLIYPWADFVRLDPGHSLIISDCAVVPSRSLTPTRFRWSESANSNAIMDGESLRLVGMHMQEASERIAEEAPQFSPKIYLDRTNSTYRKSPSETQLRDMAVANGFHVIDPGTVSAEEEIHLFVHATHIAGFYGSQMILSAAMKHPARQLYIYHDESAEMRSVSSALSTTDGVVPQWILGSRGQFVPGYSEASIQQAIVLSDAALDAARGWFEQSR